MAEGLCVAVMVDDHYVAVMVEGLCVAVMMDDHYVAVMVEGSVCHCYAEWISMSLFGGGVGTSPPWCRDRCGTVVV